MGFCGGQGGVWVQLPPIPFEVGDGVGGSAVVEDEAVAAGTACEGVAAALTVEEVIVVAAYWGVVAGATDDGLCLGVGGRGGYARLRYRRRSTAEVIDQRR